MNKNIILGSLLLLLVLAGCSVSFDKEPSTDINFGESYYEGTPEIGNWITVFIVADPLGRDGLETVDWDKISITRSEFGKPVSDLFEIDTDNIEIIRETEHVIVKIPAKILRDGSGRVGITLNRGYGISGGSVAVTTIGYIPPPKIEPLNNCGNMTENVECAIVAKDEIK